jgi:hypothetical protein
MIVALVVLAAVVSMPAKRNVKFGESLGQRVCSIITGLCLQADG